MHAAGRGNRYRGITRLMLTFASSLTRVPGETLRLHQECVVWSGKKVNLALETAEHLIVQISRQKNARVGLVFL